MGEQLPLGLRLDSHARLEDYVGDASDRLHELTGFVLVYGPKSSGKSHLLQGLCREALDVGQSVIFLSSLNKLDPSVLEGLESRTLICLDDVDEVMGQPAWQQSLFHLINAAKDQGSKLVLASTLPVADLKPALADLSSRLKGAYLVPADELCDTDKLEVIRRKAHRRGFEMSEEVCRFILSRAQRDMHHLARLVEQLDKQTLMQQKKVTIPFVKAALGL
ncbi:MAG: DnaA regulatory inactivator Hda [Pseudomonadales bacterium]|nr:DnaA regulatory inactivator Hda [Pseudomonadales bacterium]MBO6596059.1 DnaA regulatory inactivator Hda [Pseudomonadales bacterium]MBO6656401.1 DnaA regulatory inactivator Hda [Pseudomonadales bacterium]MBO6702679.1 DnaA regulatory inactivator Hda [Pseudomonadales bacterium]MBO6822542.1 DnaA regulatory inactivator Hda [Pseudomonadales bacterium]